MANLVDPSAKTLGAVLRASCRTYADGIAMLVPTGKTFEKVTYRQLYANVRRWASGVRSLGLARGDRLCIIAENSVEWALLDWACQTLGIVVVPIYPTLPSEQACYIVGNCNAKVVVCGDADQLHKVESLHGVRLLLLKGPDRSMELLGSEAALLTDEAWDAVIDQADGEDVATIIYTSGTTGLPKGAMLPHRSFVWSSNAIAGNFGIDSNDVFLSFLPLSHIFERAHDHFLPISLGATVGYTRNLASLASDIEAIKPTIVLCVPRFLESIAGRVTELMRKQGGLKQKLFNMALSQGVRHRNSQFAPLYPILDKLVGKKIRERLGGHVRLIASGGAALPSHVYNFFTAFGFCVLQGYGLTETTGAVSVNNPYQAVRGDTVGPMLKGAECKIAEDGEIYVRGEAIMLGYHALPEETDAAIDSEGWFHTGDIGIFDGDHLKITDRKKDLLVLGNGKNVAPQPLENRLRASEIIAEAVVLGDGMDACVALIIPEFSQLKALFGDRSPEELILDPAVKAAVKSEVDKLNKTLPGFEMIKRHALLAHPFTVESGELTPTLKVKRKVVLERYADIVKTLA